MKEKIKKYWFGLLIAGLIIYFAGYIRATSETMSEGTGPGIARYSTLRKRTVTITEEELNDSPDTVAVTSIHGIILRVTLVTEASSNDADWDFLLRDENDITILAKEALDSTSSQDFSYAVFEDDTGGDPHSGVAVGGAMDVVVTDATGLKDLAVNIYYLELWK